MNNAMLYFISY